VISLRAIRCEFGSGDDFREKNPIAQAPADEVGVFADETQARPLREVPFQQRPGVYIPKRPCSLAAEFIHKRGERFQFLADDFVVINKARVTGNQAVRIRNLGRGMWEAAMCLVGGISSGEGNDAPGAGKHFLGINAFGSVAFQISHFAVAFIGQPLLEVRTRCGRRGGGNAAVIKSKLPGAFLDGCFHRDGDLWRWN
jgi:hypothetical protein